MQFLGASDWYFWQGVKEGLGASLSDLHDHPMSRPLFYTKTELEACESFIDGFLLGLELTQTEYKLMTLPRKRAKVEKVEQKQVIRRPADKNKPKKNITWN